jgi:hypothetical protein
VRETWRRLAVGVRERERKGEGGYSNRMMGVGYLRRQWERRERGDESESRPLNILVIMTNTIWAFDDFI